MKALTEAAIIESWQKNVRPWIAAIHNAEIATRIQVTNQAIIDAITKPSPKAVLDVGCGEGWLVRELIPKGIDALGIDVIPEFIESASKQKVGRFKVLPYEETSHHQLKEKFDVVVCNFSLLGETSVNILFQQIPALLNDKGVFIVQTIHPIIACGNNKYEDGWREGSWAGFNESFTSPAPWYFRTIKSWKALFDANGFKLSKINEPINPITNEPASILFFGELDR